nr:hypothetical protein [Paenibacillus xylanexedens]
MENFELSYGELLAIYSGLEKLPNNAIFTHKTGDIKFQPVMITDIKEKILTRIEQIEFVNHHMNNANMEIFKAMK